MRWTSQCKMYFGTLYVVEEALQVTGINDKVTVCRDRRPPAVGQGAIHPCIVSPSPTYTSGHATIIII